MLDTRHLDEGDEIPMDSFPCPILSFSLPIYSVIVQAKRTPSSPPGTSGSSSVAVPVWSYYSNVFTPVSKPNRSIRLILDLKILIVFIWVLKIPNVIQQICYHLSSPGRLFCFRGHQNFLPKFPHLSTASANRIFAMGHLHYRLVLHLVYSLRC
uniref:Uncharacterized protein n=1 Tax=Pyxicephalus adspersus TaxID=30357 RepID=A0AAV3AVX7_PYXAD|nr:TPA: hypothetical protein GDO54_010491 [Pyxicephalus adspersus]